MDVYNTTPGGRWVLDTRMRFARVAAASLRWHTTHCDTRTGGQATPDHAASQRSTRVHVSAVREAQWYPQPMRTPYGTSASFWRREKVVEGGTRAPGGSVSRA